MRPIYWQGPDIPLLRVTWFVRIGDTWRPLEELSTDVPTKLEEKYSELTRGGIFPCEVKDNRAMANRRSGIVIRFGRIDVVVFNYHGASWLRKIFGQVRPNILRRGHPVDAGQQKPPSPVDRIVFVVHGLGQKYFGNVRENTERLQETVDSELKGCEEAQQGRPLFLPIDWRSAMTLNDHFLDIVTQKVEAGSKLFREIESSRRFAKDALADVLYYLTPQHGLEIRKNVRLQVNSAYRR